MSDKLKEVWAELGDPIMGSEPPSPRPIWQHSLLNQVQRPSWPPGAGLAQGVMHNLQQAHTHGMELIDQHENTEDLKSDLVPGYRLQRSLDYLQHGDWMQDPIDRLLFAPPG